MSAHEKKPGFLSRALRDPVSSGPKRPYFEDDFFEDDLRADDFFEPLFEPERDELDFFEPDLEPDLDPDFDELFLVADFAIAVFLSVPLQKGHGNRISRHGEETTKRRLASNRG